MKTFAFVLFTVLLSTTFLHAQTYFQPGYVINLSGDTIHGQIDYRGDLSMGTHCKFKAGDQTTVYSPNDIHSFRFVDSKYYIAKEVKGQRLFLEYLIAGQLNVYYCRDKSGDHYYIENDTLPLKELEYREEIRYDDKNVAYFHESKKYIGYLKYYTQDAPQLKNRIESSKKPDHNSLIKLAKDYHNIVCTDETCIVYEKKIPALKILMEPQTTIVGFRNADKFATEAGVNFHIWAPRSSENLYFKTGISFSLVSANSEIGSYFKIPLQLEYMPKAYKIKPVIGLGYNFYSIAENTGYEYGHTISLNAGVAVPLNKKIKFSACINSDFTPLSIAAMDEDSSFNLIAYGFSCGLLIEL